MLALTDDQAAILRAVTGERTTGLKPRMFEVIALGLLSENDENGLEITSAGYEALVVVPQPRVWAAGDRIRDQPHPGRRSAPCHGTRTWTAFLVLAGGDATELDFAFFADDEAGLTKALREMDKQNVRWVNICDLDRNVTDHARRGWHRS